MSRPDSAAAAQLDQTYIGPVFLAWLDILGDPVRANSSGGDITFAGMPDPELNGTYLGVSPDLVKISDVKVTEGGTDTVTASLSGIVGLDNDTLSQISDPANWRGRPARLWRIIRNEADVQQGGVQAYYTGYMTRLTVTGSAAEQQITVGIESYLAMLTAASNRTYLDQADFDPGDQSARASIPIANGTSIQGVNPGPGYRGGGGFGRNEIGRALDAR